MSYDAAGNVTARGLRTMVYNDDNRLIQSIEGSKVKGEYTYNGLGQRVKKVAGRTITYYLYDRAGNLMAEMDGAGVIMNEYVYVDGEPLAMIYKPGQRKEATFYYLNDHLTSPKMLTDASGALAWQGDREPFGTTTATLENTINNFRFPGQYYDEETGLHYNWHRYYDPQTGRYLRTDPLGLGGGINLYLYAGGNPVNFVDPMGLKTTITITNTKFTASSISGAISATSDRSYVKPFYGAQIQDSRAGSCECKPALADGTYPGFVRTDRNNRIELRGTGSQNLTRIQIHVANAPTVNGEEKLNGCFGVGVSSGMPDWVNNSADAMQSIMDVVNADGSGDIEVIVTTPTPQP
jgi:RHS repeat-associated protein